MAEAIDHCATEMYYSRTMGCLHASMGSSAKPSANLPTTAESYDPSADRVVRGQDINPNILPSISEASENAESSDISRVNVMENIPPRPGSKHVIYNNCEP